MPIFALYAYEVAVSVPTLLFFRFFIASCCFIAYLFYKRINLNQTKAHFKSLLALGIFYTFVAALYFLAVKYIAASLAVLLFYTYPVLVVLLSLIIEKQAITRNTVAVLMLSGCGLFLVLGKAFGEISSIGVILAFSAACFYACYIVTSNRVVKKINSILISTCVTIITCLAMFIIGLATDTLTMVYSLQAWYAIIGISLISTVMSMLTFFYGLNIVGATQAAILSTFEPLVTISLSSILFDETLSFYQWIGAILVLLGAIFSVKHNRSNNTES